jgi:coniferyl-aldehyde dehydrogenase
MMSEAETKQIERMKALLTAQKEAFASERHRPLAKRRDDIDRIAKICRDNADAIADAISADFGTRARQESVLAEIAYVIQDVAHTRKNLKRWAADRKVAVPMNLLPGKAYIRRDPKGVVGIIAPWNYPVQLALAPLVAALASGCRALLKPSELTPATAELLKRLITEHFDDDHVTVITGGPAVGQAFGALKFDHLFFTGSPQIGRLVALAAADNLVPVTLELGGKSPAILTSGYPHESAAKAIAWGKSFNAGQTCIAPDYAFVPKGDEEALADALIKEFEKQFSDAATDDAYTAIVSDRHYDRLTAMIDEARNEGARIVQPSHDPEAAKAARKIVPTLVINPAPECQLMTEEIFGPVLPIIGYKSLDGAINDVSDGEHPLALYVFSTEQDQIDEVLDGTHSGGVCINSTLVHYSVPDLPFGGIGTSGIGAYHGEDGFRTFCHERSVFHTPKWHPSRLLAPPYGKVYESLAKKQMG